MRLRGLTALAGASLASVLAVAAAAFAGGGVSIATAPVIPLAQEQTNALNSIDFWGVQLKLGDQLTLRFTGQTNDAHVEVCLFKPDVTDAALGNQPCYAKQTAYGAAGTSTLTLTARAVGRWTIAVVPWPGCESNGIVDLRCRVGLQYRLTAYVRHPTHLTVNAPNLVRVGARFTIRGRLTGVRGRVLLELSRDGGSHWSTLGVESTTRTGAFSQTLRLRKAASLLVRASYPEAQNYAGSTATTTVRIA